jgi:hypothetical protein
MPLKVYKEYLRTMLGSDVTQEVIDERAAEHFGSKPELWPKVARPWGMLIEANEPKNCARYAFSRSLSNKNETDGFPHSASWHENHLCSVIDEDGLIQTNVGSSKCLPILVDLFLKIDAGKRCIVESTAGVGYIQSFLKSRFPGNHVCVRTGLM